MRTRKTINTKEDSLMKLNIYSIYDTAAGLYSRPFFCQSDAEAIRMFADLSVDAEHPVGNHPEDYSLFRLGIYDDVKGSLGNEDNECLSTALEQVAKSRKVNSGKQLDLVNEVENKHLLNTLSDALIDEVDKQ